MKNGLFGGGKKSSEYATTEYCLPACALFI